MTLSVGHRERSNRCRGARRFACAASANDTHARNTTRNRSVFTPPRCTSQAPTLWAQNICHAYSSLFLSTGMRQVDPQPNCAFVAASTSGGHTKHKPRLKEVHARNKSKTHTPEIPRPHDHAHRVMNQHAQRHQTLHTQRHQPTVATKRPHHHPSPGRYPCQQDRRISGQRSSAKRAQYPLHGPPSP